MQIFIKSLLLCFIFLISTSVISASVLENNVIFTDVNEDDFAYPAINYLVDEGFAKGYKDGSFKPDAKINRAEFLKIVFKARYENKTDAKNCFPDVKDEWFAPYVCAAKESGIINGYPDGNFYPEKEINFAEASKIIVNALKLKVDVENRESWYEAYVVALADEQAIPYTIVDFEYPITRRDVACIISGVDDDGDSYKCESLLTYEKIKGISSVDGEKRHLADMGDNVILFYEANGKVYMVDFYGNAYLLDGADPDSFRHLVGDLYSDNEKIFKIFTYQIDLGELPERVTVFDKTRFDLPTLEKILTETNEHWFIKDKDNLYFSCGHDRIDGFIKVDGFDENKFKILGHFQSSPIFGFSTYFTDANKLYASFSDWGMECKVDSLEVDLDTFEMVFDKPKDGRSYDEYKGFYGYPDYNYYGNLMFLKDKNYVYDPVKLSILEWADPKSIQVYSVEYKDSFYHNESKSFYYILNNDQIWLKDREAGEFVANSQIDAPTFEFVGDFEYEATPFPGYYVRDDETNYIQTCEEEYEDFGEDMEEMAEDGTINSIILNGDGTCILRHLFPIEDETDDIISIHGVLFKDKENIWIFDSSNKELNNLTIDIDLDIASFDMVPLSNEEGFKGLFKDKDGVYFVQDNKLKIVNGMDTETIKVISNQNKYDSWDIFDKNGQWEYSDDLWRLK